MYIHGSVNLRRTLMFIMSRFFRERLLQDLAPSGPVDDESSPSLIANCVFNVFFSFTAVVLNILTIHAIRKLSSLPRALKTLLLSLAVSDLGVGLLVQPFYIALLVNRLQGNIGNCATLAVFGIFLTLFSVTSFFGVMALIVDRFLAIQLHLRYQELVTQKRVSTGVISIWLASLFFTLLAMCSPRTISSKILGISGIACFVTTVFLNYKIYIAVRSHRNQIQPLQIQQNGQLANIAHLRKSAVSTFCIYLVFVICFLPQIFNFVASMISGSKFASNHFFFYSITLIFLNSSLNPLICWKMRAIRGTITATLRNIFRSQN